ncbi:MAG: hypothetical protein AAB874_00250, partial [Patescibacteria group bacterium]
RGLELHPTIYIEDGVRHLRERIPKASDYDGVVVELVHMDTLIGKFAGPDTLRLLKRVSRLMQGGVQFNNIWDTYPSGIPLDAHLDELAGQTVIIGGVMTWACVKIRAMNINDINGIAIIDNAICLRYYGT